MKKIDEDVKEDKSVKSVDGAMPVKAVKLTSDFCAKKQLGKAIDYVTYPDTSEGFEQRVKLELDIQTFSAMRKGDLSAIAFERFPKDPILAQMFETEIIVAEALGMEHLDIVNLKSNLPSGVYDCVVYLVKQRLGEYSGLTETDINEAKNTEGQE